MGKMGYSLFCVTFLVLFLQISADNPVPDDCLTCICMVESGCLDPFPEPLCIEINNISECGPYNITFDYWKIGKRQKGGVTRGNKPKAAPDPQKRINAWLACADSLECSKEIVQCYMKRYATEDRLGYSPTCEDFARIHDGGPNGYKMQATDTYWERVEECLLDGP